ncbi:Legionaminic acid biosynthesis protein PtmG [Legionella pneumophila subsp. pneumophila LPE509]|nr:Legionaminic acid biosynthesis protein PtmG [Legionella pneumophila subsp. pneumophila LPE509]
MLISIPILALDIFKKPQYTIKISGIKQILIEEPKYII